MELNAHVAKMRMLGRMCGVTRKDRIRNKNIRSNFWMTAIEIKKNKEYHLRWFWHMYRWPKTAILRQMKVYLWKVQGEEGDHFRLQPVRNEMPFCEGTEGMTLNGIEWKNKIHKCGPI